jgi:predicted TIM-barrel fold metal-dependent hydrolase
MISSDSHVVETPDLFVSRIDRRFVDEAPRVIEEDGRDWWVVGKAKVGEGYDDQVLPAVNPARAGDRFVDEKDREQRFKLDSSIRPGGHDPDAWIKDNEADGVYGGVLFPSLSLVFYSIESSDLLTAVCRAYTDWVIEFASAHPDRLRALAMINLDDIPAAVTELERARNKGAAGALIPVAPPADRPYDGPEYEPFWAAAESLEMPLNMHIATNRTPGEWKRLYRVGENISAPDYWVRVSLADMVFSGIFERHPRLKIGSVENEGGWAAYFVKRMDHIYIENPDYDHDKYPRFKNGAVPSDFVGSNVFICFSEDDVAVHDRRLIGLDALMWGNDYPHAESTFPKSQEIVETRFTGVPAEDRLKMTRDNVAALYQFAVPLDPAS